MDATTTRRARVGNYEILVILAATIVNVGACSPAPAPPPASAPSPSSSAFHSDAGGLVRRSEPGSRPASAARLFVDSDMVMQLAMSNVDNLPKPLRGPAMFAMGFSQQNMKNLMSTVRSLGQMLVSSLVMMAVKRIFFADLRTEADRNKASGLTDALLDVINLLNF